MDHPSGNVKQTLAEAEAARKAGDIARAAELYAAILARMPAHAKARSALKRLQKQAGISGGPLSQAEVDQAVQLLQNGQFAQAATLVRLLLGKAPKEALLHNILGMALSNMGEQTKAAASFQAAVRLRPAYAEAQGNLGSVLVQMGQAEKAVPVLERAVALNPDLVQNHHNLGAALAQMGRYPQAIDAFDRALALDPSHVNALNGKADALAKLGHTHEAIELFEQALKLAPDDPALLVNMAYALVRDDRVEKAIAHLEKALKLAPDMADAWYRLGVQYGNLGRMNDAISALNRAIDRDPDMAEAWRTMTTLRKYKGSEPEIAPIETAYEASPQDSPARMHLAFARGKISEDLGRHDQAFTFWTEGNRIRRAQFDYRIDIDQKRAQRIREIFTAYFMASYDGPRDESRKPVLIVGMMRSGTTLAEQIIASHPQAAAAGELEFIPDFGQNALESFAGTLPDLAGFTRDYLALLDRYGPNAARVVDKMPANFFWLGLVRMAFPNATIINMQRDPRDTCLSIWKNYFSGFGHAYAYDLKELAQFYLLYRDLMDHWDRVMPGVVHHCSYEKLTSDPESEARRLLAACGLDWDPRVLEFHKSATVVKTASVSQVRQKIYQSSVKGWKRHEVGLEPLIEILSQAGRV